VSYVKALGNIGGVEAARAVLKEAQLCNADTHSSGCSTARSAARAMNDVWLPQEATKELKSFLSSNKLVFGVDQEFPQYGNLLIVMDYIWTEGQPLFADLLLNNKYVGVRKRLLSDVASTAGLSFLGNPGELFPLLPNTIEEDPFIASHRRIYRQLTSDDDRDLRIYALFLYLATSKDVNDVKDLVRLSLDDADGRISALGAQAAENFGLQEHLTTIRKKYDASNKYWLRHIYCRSLNKLGKNISC
jgi:hypothetical protein